MSVPVRARRLSQDEGQYLLRLVRRGRQESIRVRRGLMILASSSGTPVPAIARLVAADEDTVRDVIHAFNDRGLAALDPHWAGGAPRRISDDDVAFIVTTAATRPKKLALPFTRFSVRKLAAYLQGRYGHHDPKQVPARQVRIRRERLRRILAAHDITFQRTRTWKESTDADFESKLDRIEEVTTEFLGRCFAFDQFGPLSIRPCHGTCWAARNHPDRLRATYKRTHGIRYFHGCYDMSQDKLWGVLRRRKGGDHTLAALKTIRAARPDGAPIYVILDNLSANKTPTSASWADPIEAQFGPLRAFTMANSDYPNHVVLTRDLQAYLRWRNANARHPDVIAAQRRERARVRSERHQRWGRPHAQAA